MSSERPNNREQNQQDISAQSPKFYQVILLNDDFTPMAFVVQLLCEVFHMSEDRAHSLMWNIHNDGRGVCGIYTREVAETYVTLSNRAATKNGHPLLTQMEPIDEDV